MGLSVLTLLWSKGTITSPPPPTAYGGSGDGKTQANALSFLSAGRKPYFQVSDPLHPCSCFWQNGGHILQQEGGGQALGNLPAKSAVGLWSLRRGSRHRHLTWRRAGELVSPILNGDRSIVIRVNSPTGHCPRGQQSYGPLIIGVNSPTGRGLVLRAAENLWWSGLHHKYQARSTVGLFTW